MLRGLFCCAPKNRFWVFQTPFHLTDEKTLICWALCGKITLKFAASELKHMLLYHGSNVEVQEPRLLRIQRDLDFGRGFLYHK